MTRVDKRIHSRGFYGLAEALQLGVILRNAPALRAEQALIVPHTVGGKQNGHFVNFACVLIGAYKSALKLAAYGR